ncbi:alpha-N-acetylglucosaminidase [Morus notabilis]|uniref:alpha-N-acetylglucosaminidase n=1 Tax=Morus notabilis TaxID=981085 RepID=UPI000CED6AF1|nr:alpha-N-acetylglucosaminidase [Morus notabilis]
MYSVKCKAAFNEGMNLGDLNKVWEIKALKKPGEEEAEKILERIAKHVQPIMRNHKWRVKLLSEFCPNNPSLLGLNVGGGVQVKLRLWRPNRDWDFFPFDQILDTMLHELCHNVHAPHNASFYNLWDELRKDVCHGHSCFILANYNLSSKHGPEIMIKGTTGVELASGLHWYLKYWCGAHISWDKTAGAQIASIPNPGSLPLVKDEGVMIQRPVLWNYYQNVVTSRCTSGGANERR